jgi:TonB family protein
MGAMRSIALLVLVPPLLPFSLSSGLVQAREPARTVALTPIEDRAGVLDPGSRAELQAALRAALQEGGVLQPVAEPPAGAVLSADLARRPAGETPACELTLTLRSQEASRTLLQLGLRGGCDGEGVRALARRAAEALRAWRPAPGLVGPVEQPPDTRIKDPFVQPAEGLDRAAILRVVQAKRGQVRACYERSLKASPALAGRLTVDFTIGARGRVTQVSLKESTLSSTEVERCILAAVKAWVFPAPADGQPTTISFPFVFQAAN